MLCSEFRVELGSSMCSLHLSSLRTAALVSERMRASGTALTEERSEIEEGGKVYKSNYTNFDIVCETAGKTV